LTQVVPRKLPQNLILLAAHLSRPQVSPRALERCDVIDEEQHLAPRAQRWKKLQKSGFQSFEEREKFGELTPRFGSNQRG
jgi:hypothetical protein